MNVDNIAEILIPQLKTGDKVLQENIKFEWKEGEQWCVSGSSGSGKTTLLKVIAGIRGMPAADISFPRLEKIKRESVGDFMVSQKIAFVPQEVKIPSGFLPDLYYQRRYHATEQDNIPTVKEILFKQSNSNEVMVSTVSELMSLADYLHQPFVQLSNGQTRRLMIAIALLKEPNILILDNPYSGLDQKARLSLNNHIGSLINKGVHIMVAAHEHEIQHMTFITNTLRLKSENLKDDGLNLPKFYSQSTNEKDSVNSPIRMNNIVVKYHDKIVLNVPLWNVEAKDKWVIRGANGSGKSTLLSLIVADHPQAYSNDIMFFGNKRGNGESIWQIKKRIGYFSSELLRYFSTQTISKYVIASGWNDITWQHSYNYSEEQLELLDSFSKWLGISHLLDIKFGSLSFSQKKMVLIARAMIRSPQILILDEPLQGMDSYWKEQFKTKIAEFAKFRTVLYVTHDEDEIPNGEWKLLTM